MLAEIADHLQILPWPPLAGVPFWAALALVAGGILGEAVRRGLGLPRIVGYSLVGLGLGLAGVGAEPPTGSARLIVDLALALLLFELGSRVHLRWLRANPALLLTSLAAALSRAASGTCASGAVVARVAVELRAAGPVTDRMTLLATINTLAAVLAKKLVVGGCTWTSPATGCARSRSRCGPSAVRRCWPPGWRRWWHGSRAGPICATRTRRCCCCSA